MLTSLRWLNRLLDPGDLSADDAERALTRAGFPIEGREELPGADTRLDVEITSNRGDCMSHLGVAREIAAATGRRLVEPAIPFDVMTGRPLEGSAPAGLPSTRDVAGVENRAPEACSRFTARVIRGVRVGPSPAWLREALESVGQRSINNVVDASNFVLFELGNPTHAFDLNTLSGRRLVIRWAREGEPLTMLDGKSHPLKADELVVADATRAVSLAGVMGGLDTAVTTKTTDILLEAATWDPATIRRAARRLRIVTDAGKRFERFVDARTLDFAAARVAAIILETGAGQLLPDAIGAGLPLPEARTVDLRAERCRRLLGVQIEAKEMSRCLAAVGVMNKVIASSDALQCVVPAHRSNDLTREVDLIEEVARVHGYERIPIAEKIEITAAPPQDSERAVRELSNLLVGMGFFETVTFSFVTKEEAALFMPAGRRALAVDEERRKGAPYLRPSTIPSLLHCRRINQDAGASPPGMLDAEINLFELGAGFAEADGAGRRTIEFRSLALLSDAPDPGTALRRMKGAVERVVAALAGVGARLVVQPRAARCPAEDVGATAEVLLNGAPVGSIGLVSRAALAHYGLDVPTVAAELDLASLIALYPPKGTAAPLPAFPAIERDLSIVVPEATPWSAVAHLVESTGVEKLAGFAFVGVYRGKQVGPGAKSVTLRLRFQDPDRTLRHEEVDPQVGRLVERLRSELGAALRT